MHMRPTRELARQIRRCAALKGLGLGAFTTLCVEEWMQRNENESFQRVRAFRLAEPVVS